MSHLKRRQRNWEDDNDYFEKMLGINKKPVTDESSDLKLCVAIVAVAMISNKKGRKKRVVNLNRADQKELVDSRL